ncbi:MAG TPA: response regulator [Verrucomicrobiae bacterium]|nr:response regulator [Verrucomicrobiae bacterium]
MLFPESGSRRTGGRGDRATSALVAEDDPLTREVLRLVLARKYPAMTVYFATNGEEGLRLFREHAPGIVITDISMPVMDGIQMSREIKAIAAATTIIVVTAYADVQSFLADLSDAGIVDCIAKPVDFGQLEAAINRALDQ